MGKLHKRRNWRARQPGESAEDTAEDALPPVQIELKDADTLKGVDKSNALVLPSKKTKTKQIIHATSVKKPLSRKQKKVLQKVLEQKEKKLERSEMLNKLSEVQIPENELKLLYTTSKMGTGDRLYLSKRPIHEAGSSGQDKISSISGANKRARRDSALEEVSAEKSDSSVSSDTSEDEEEHLRGKLKADGDVLYTEQHKHIAMEPLKKEKPVLKEQAVPKNQMPVHQASSKPAVFIPVDRTPEVQEARLKLPILAEEHAIMEAIAENHVVVLCGETGSGKTTQVPQFLYEAGYGSDDSIIGITEPRRVAALTMSQRVAMEMNLSQSSAAGTMARIPRKPNFSEDELLTLHRSVEEFKGVLFPEPGVKVSVEEKFCAWQAVAQRVNKFGVAHRELVEIKKKWKDLKRVGRHNRFRIKKVHMPRLEREISSEAETKAEKQRSRDNEGPGKDHLGGGGCGIQDGLLTGGGTSKRFQEAGRIPRDTPSKPGPSGHVHMRTGTGDMSEPRKAEWKTCKVPRPEDEAAKQPLGDPPKTIYDVLRHQRLLLKESRQLRRDLQRHKEECARNFKAISEVLHTLLVRVFPPSGTVPQQTPIPDPDAPAHYRTS